ncbi:hypothetical protein ABTN28_19470, partial [Acinetobacter baumannii]
QSGYYIFKNGAQKWGIYTDIGSNDLKFFDDSGDRLTIKQGGNVGVGTSAPAVKLQVAGGDASITGTNYTYTGAQARLWLGDNAGT